MHRAATRLVHVGGVVVHGTPRNLAAACSSSSRRGPSKLSFSSSSLEFSEGRRRSRDRLRLVFIALSGNGKISFPSYWLSEWPIEVSPLASLETVTSFVSLLSCSRWVLELRLVGFSRWIRVSSLLCALCCILIAYLGPPTGTRSFMWGPWWPAVGNSRT